MARVRGILEHGQAVAAIIGIPAAAIAIIQASVGVLPWHAISTAGTLGVLLLIQGAAPWRHRKWDTAALAEYGGLLLRVNAIFFGIVFALAVSCLAVGFLWQNAPAWIENGVVVAIQTGRVRPIAAVSRATPTSVATLPPTAFASITPLPQPLSPGTPPTSPTSQTVSLYSTKALLATTIGSTEKYSERAFLAAVIQVIWIIVLMVGEPIAEVAFRKDVGHRGGAA